MDKRPPIVLELEVPKNPDEILSFTKLVLSNILSHRTLSISEQRRIKMILIELVTNSIKHASGVDSQLNLLIEHLKLTIQKKEKGLKIEFTSNQQQIPFEELNKTIIISFSQANRHHIKTLGQYEFKFLNPFTEGVAINQMPEHFGFYIITLASDSFFYQYNPDIEENKFTVHINLLGN